jgi:hypothetical protein
MTRYMLLIAILTLSSIGFAQETNAAVPNDMTKSLRNVIIYPNLALKSVVVDFYEKDFKAVTVYITDLSGNMILEYTAGDIASGSFVEVKIPNEITSSSILITIKSEGKLLVRQVRA